MENQDKGDRQKPSKIKMGSDWTPKERRELIAILDGEIVELDAEEQKLRETILYEAPCFREIAGKRQRLDELRTYAEQMPSPFLEANRDKYAAFVA